MKDKFITYVRTLQLQGTRLKGSKNIIKPVHVSQKEIEARFFVYPEYNRKNELNNLVKSGELSISEDKATNGRKYKVYAALKDGDIDFSLVKPKVDNFTNPIILKIREHLKEVSLKDGATSTPYFDTFLQNKDKYINLFFTVDEFARRVHTPITNFHREYRKNILFYGNKTASLDVATMQPLLLGKILTDKIGKNEYSNWINSGEDIYVMLQQKAKLETRDQSKKRFFEILFAPPSNALAEMFGASVWINWINEYKTLRISQNPHNTVKRYSNLAWLLQTTEVQIMFQVWRVLYDNNIPFLTIHDEVIIQEQDKHKAEQLFREVLSKEFEYFKLNNKISDTNNWNIPNFENIILPKEPIKLNAWTTIIDVNKFVENSIATVKANNGNPTYLPYLEQLQELKHICKQ